MIEAHGTTHRPRIVVAHDWLCGLRGGERVLERICTLVGREYEPAGLLTMFDDGQSIGTEVDRWVAQRLLKTSWLNELPAGPRALRRWLLPLYPAAVRALGRKLARIHARSRVDLVISTSSAAIKGLKTPEGVPHLCYCHSPARYVWSRKEEYSAGSGVTARLRRAGLSLFADGFASWDRQTAANVDRFIANSTHTAAEIRRCFGAESTVIHPPVRTEFFTPDAAVERSDFWLIVGAVEPYKQVDLAIQAAAIARAPLVIVGSGSELKSVMSRSGGAQVSASRALNGPLAPGPMFLGRVEDDVLRDLYRRARLLLFPQVEDFGITAVEAQACGLPVVARAQGGALDIVRDGQTGVLVKEATAESIAKAAAAVPSSQSSACRDNALRFSEARFDDAIVQEISRFFGGV